MILSKVILLSLSKEALSAMIEQFALQDQAFDLPYTPCSDSYTPAEDTHSKGRITPWDGRGCFALSLVSRRFHDLTAPFILETLTSKGASQPLFRYKLVGKYGPLILPLVLNDGSSPREHEAVIRAVSSVSTHSDLRRLEPSTKAV